MTKRKASVRYGSGAHYRDAEARHGLVHPDKDEQWLADEMHRAGGPVKLSNKEFDFSRMRAAAERNARRLNAGKREKVWTTSMTVAKRERVKRAHEGAPTHWCECNGIRHKAYSAMCSLKGE